MERIDEIWEACKSSRNTAEFFFKRCEPLCDFLIYSIITYLGCQPEDCEFSVETKVIPFGIPPPTPGWGQRIKAGLGIEETPTPGWKPDPLGATTNYQILKMSFISPDGFKIPVQFEFLGGEDGISIKTEDSREFHISKNRMAQEVSPVLDATYELLMLKAKFWPWCVG